MARYHLVPRRVPSFLFQGSQKQPEVPTQCGRPPAASSA